MGAAKLTKWLGLCVAVTLAAASAVRADLDYPYSDDFSGGRAQTDSYRHSQFWPSGAVLLHEPYLSYVTVDKNQGIAFLGYEDQLAELAYRFPIDGLTAQRSVKGVLSVDVSYPVTQQFDQYWPGKLLYQTSPDGMGWTQAVELPAGHHEFPITSPSGICYVLFSGTRAVIDNLAVSLNSKPVTIVVPDDFATIQEAVRAAGDGDVIEVKPGTYRGQGNRDIEFYGRAITLRSANGPQSTVIDCEGGHRAFYFHEGEGADTEVSGFTIRGAQIPGSSIPADLQHWTRGAANPVGGGIYCEFSSPTIDNCIISGCNTALGGGIGVVGAEPMITNCTIEQCSASGRGAGIGLLGAPNATITQCIIRNNNSSAGLGGGLYAWQSGAAVTGCTFSTNSAKTGGGAYCGAPTTDVTFQNCIFSKNVAEAGAALLADQQSHVTVINCTVAANKYTSSSSSAAAVYTNTADILINNSILYSNLYNNSPGKSLVIVSPVSKLPVTYSDVEGGYTGPGNIQGDPRFADLSNEDYHLKSLYGRYDPQARQWFRDTEHSPCIDMGDPAASVADEPAPNAGRINMGAYGGTREASKGEKDHAIFYVDGSGVLDGAFRSIQAAIDAAEEGDTVLVMPGTYRESLCLDGKAIRVQSAGDAAVLTSPGDFAVSFYHVERTGTVLANFVITGCGQGAIFCEGASPTLKNLTIVKNPAGVVARAGADPNIINCILWANYGADLTDCSAKYSDVQGTEKYLPDTKAGNIKDEPKFVDLERGDYHLQSRVGHYVPALDTWVQDTETSPCIDAGDPKEDPRGERVPNGRRIDMGAHGGTPFASLSPRG